MKILTNIIDVTVRVIAGLWSAGLFALGGLEAVNLLLDPYPETILALAAFGVSGIGAIGLLLSVRQGPR